MANNENQNKIYRIYIKPAKKWVEVSEEVYWDHVHHYGALRKRAQYHDQCICPKGKSWLCDGDCFKCEFHRAGDMLSLNYENKDEDGNTYSLLGNIPDATPPVDEIVCSRVYLNQFFARLAELMPEAEEIGRLRMAGLSGEAIAGIIGVRRTTFLSRLAKVQAVLAEEYPDLF